MSTSANTAADCVLAYHADVPVLVIPEAADALERSVPKTLELLVQHGHDRVLLDLRAVHYVDRGVARLLADVVLLARRRGLAIGAVAPCTVAAALQSFEETRVPCGCDLAQALERLNDARRGAAARHAALAGRATSRLDDALFAAQGG